MEPKCGTKMWNHGTTGPKCGTMEPLDQSVEPWNHWTIEWFDHMGSVLYLNSFFHPVPDNISGTESVQLYCARDFIWNTVIQIQYRNANVR